MRKREEFVKAYFTPQLRPWRKERKQTQEEAAEILWISNRAYGNLERGESGFSTVTMILYLSYLSDEEIVHHIRAMYEGLFEMECGGAE